MILLDIKNQALEEALTLKFNACFEGSKLEKTDIILADFDGVLYHISNPENDKTKLIISISLKYFKELLKYGADTFLKKEYQGYCMSEPENGYDFSICYDLKTLVEESRGDVSEKEEGQEEFLPVNKDKIYSLIYKASTLKRNCLAGLFLKYFDSQNVKLEGALIHYREDEAMYIEAKEDRVTVVFSTLFHDEDDCIIGKIFLQEFKEGRKASQNAPHILFSSSEPPREFKERTDVKTAPNMSYITFILLPRHLTPQCRDNTIDLIFMFRNYLHYHIKCSKAYIHSRMRAKTSEFLKILNRAKPEKTLPAVFHRDFGSRKSLQPDKMNLFTKDIMTNLY
ncbi:actin-related protein 2/3 complex subunit 2-B-like isoform X2 [Gordionus sp. m RMFG-2023]|uniref:actin-related protein 2/3 complex subunit 2-B-like isoform X2 n=1 Tax=Gordionus sp. m RMFG-2023 TaxID=3053472 RepID=UPI0031FE1A8B